MNKQAVIGHVLEVERTLYSLQLKYPYGIPVQAFREAYASMNVSLWHIENMVRECNAETPRTIDKHSSTGRGWPRVGG